MPREGAGERLQGIAVHLTGGERPTFRDFGFRTGTWQGAVLGTGGPDGTIKRLYRWTNGEITAEELAFNQQMVREEAEPYANPLRTDGVRWLPLVQGDITIPVLTMHTLGDFYVPFRHQQLYREGAIAKGKDQLLVQRAIRAPSHCDFSATEITAVINDLLAWVNDGDVPAGDEVLDPDIVAADDYGCQFTNNVGSSDRGALPACPIAEKARGYRHPWLIGLHRRGAPVVPRHFTLQLPL